MGRRTLLLAGPGACLLLYAATLITGAFLEERFRAHCQQGAWKTLEYRKAQAWAEACSLPRGWLPTTYF
jgi:hypothetical protein